MIFHQRFMRILRTVFMGSMVFAPPAHASSSLKEKAKITFQAVLEKGKGCLKDEQLRKWGKRSIVEVGIAVLIFGGGGLVYKRFFKKPEKENNNTE